jgi:hypothetical protein
VAVPVGDVDGLVAIRGDMIVVGAPLQIRALLPAGFPLVGSAYVFYAHSGGPFYPWSRLQPLQGVQDYFGSSVAISGDTIVVGAMNDASSTTGIDSVPNDFARLAGAAYVFTRSEGGWIQKAYLKPAAVGTTQQDDQFGNSVAISGDTIVVGAMWEDSSTTGVNSTPNESAYNAGAAHVFLITPDTEPAPNVTAQCTITSSAVVFNRATGRFRQTVTLWNHGGALYATALALDGLPAGVALYMPSGFTSAAAPVGSPYRELGPIGVSVPPVNQPVTVSVTLEFTRTGTQPITYTPRVLGAGLR